MAYADFVYGVEAHKILERGVKEYNERTGTYTMRRNNVFVDLDPADFGLPILEGKKVFWKTAIDELFWIFIKGSDKISDLKVPKIWEKWADENGSIGKSYGYQAGKPFMFKLKGEDIWVRNQLDYVIQLLKRDPSSRQAEIDLWDPEDLVDMQLPPCVFAYSFTISDNKLNLLVTQRSADWAVGVPFDWLEAAVLQLLVIHELKREGLKDLEVGKLSFSFADAHVYEVHESELREQLEFTNQMSGESERERPALVIPDKSIWKMKADELEVINYVPGPARSYDLIK